MRFPFEATPEELGANLDGFVDAVFSCLESEFLVMPKGEGFIEYPVFEQGYESLKARTAGFVNLDPAQVLGQVCVHRRNPDSDSDGRWTAVPIEGGQ